MNKTPYTPGPWQARRRCDSRTDWVVRSEDYGTIADVSDYEHNAARIEPDARLLAAAPELLEACQEVYAQDGMCIYGTSELIEADDAVKEAFRLGSALAFTQCARTVRAAIAKAEGSPPDFTQPCEKCGTPTDQQYCSPQCWSESGPGAPL